MVPRLLLGVQAGCASGRVFLADDLADHCPYLILGPTGWTSRISDGCEEREGLGNRMEEDRGRPADGGNPFSIGRRGRTQPIDRTGTVVSGRGISATGMREAQGK